MKDGIHGNRERIEELSATSILRELYDKEIDKMETDGTFEALPKKEVIKIKKVAMDKNLKLTIHSE